MMPAALPALTIRTGELPRMIQASRAISLILISSTAVLAGYRAFESYSNGWPTTRPTTWRSSYHGSGYYHSGYYTGGSGGWIDDSSGGSSSYAARGTSRGGFGSSGRAVGS